MSLFVLCWCCEQVSREILPQLFYPLRHGDVDRLTLCVHHHRPPFLPRYVFDPHSHRLGYSLVACHWWRHFHLPRKEGAGNSGKHPRPPAKCSLVDPLVSEKFPFASFDCCRGRMFSPPLLPSTGFPCKCRCRLYFVALPLLCYSFQSRPLLSPPALRNDLHSHPRARTASSRKRIRCQRSDDNGKRPISTPPPG